MCSDDAEKLYAELNRRADEMEDGWSGEAIDAVIDRMDVAWWYMSAASQDRWRAGGGT